MKYLGIDYGTKRVGLALSDDGGTLAFPHAVLENTIGLTAAIEDIIRSEKIDEIIMGESVGLDGTENPVQKQIKGFAEALDLKLHYRMLDVSSMKVWMQGRHGIEYQKPDIHRAFDDIQASIAEWQYYLEKLKEL
jgi:putative transcription antitermination factor YqgF